MPPVSPVRFLKGQRFRRQLADLPGLNIIIKLPT